MHMSVAPFFGARQYTMKYQCTVPADGDISSLRGGIVVGLGLVGIVGFEGWDL